MPKFSPHEYRLAAATRAGDPKADPRDGRRRCHRRAPAVDSLDRCRARYDGCGLPAHRARSGRPDRSIDPDVVVLDVDMPELDGISALPLLLKKKRDLIVIMASTLTRRSAEISLRALSLGAADYVPKPEPATDAPTSAAFHRELIDKIRSLAAAASLDRAAPACHRPAFEIAAPQRPSVRRAEGPTFTLRPFACRLPRALLIGSSTGGPQALTTLIGQIDATMERAPILITQHMPATFTTVLAEHLARISGRPVREAEHGERRCRRHLCRARRPAHARRARPKGL